MFWNTINKFPTHMKYLIDRYVEFFCDTVYSLGNTQMCRDTRFEKHWFGDLRSTFLWFLGINSWEIINSLKYWPRLSRHDFLRLD
jgi:hypothetical protein